jgi:predicted nucleic acid-binding protein
MKKMSLADCFAAALAKREKAEVYTGDPEFKTVEKSKSFGYSSFLRL